MRQRWTQLKPNEFPPLLREIPDAPEELWLEGVLPKWDKTRVLAVVGSRKYSQYGKDACEKIISGLAGYSIIIVSGLAIGIDTIVHKAALKAGLITIAVPGSGLDRSVLHPRSNARLADEIVESGGALISEQPPTAPAGLHTFPRRNRIMAGLSHAVLIAEAGEQSGTLITARLALDYNREVMAVPGSIFSPNSFGTNYLIKQGAVPVTESGDILKIFGLEEKENGQGKLFENLSPQEKKIVEILFIEALSRDELIKELEMSVSEANTLLSAMEIKGIIAERMGEVRLA